jgi:hypothetical protein
VRLAHREVPFEDRPASGRQTGVDRHRHAAEREDGEEVDDELRRPRAADDERHARPHRGGQLGLPPTEPVGQLPVGDRQSAALDGAVRRAGLGQLADPLDTV